MDDARMPETELLKQMGMARRVFNEGETRDALPREDSGMSLGRAFNDIGAKRSGNWKV